MPAFNRLAISPSLELLTKLTQRALAAWVPTGYRWFKRAQLDAGQIGKQLRAWGAVLGNLRMRIARQRYSILLQTAVGTDLDVVCLSLGFYRQPGEVDGAFARRAAASLSRARITPNALVAIIPELSQGDRAGQLYEPWTHIKMRGGSLPRSGLARRPGGMLYRGAVLELQANGEVAGLQAAIDDRRAGGVIGYQGIFEQSSKDLLLDDALLTVVGGMPSQAADGQDSFFDDP